MEQYFEKLMKLFKKSYRKRAFVHWYGQSEYLFEEAENYLNTIINDYKDALKEISDGEGEE